MILLIGGPGCTGKTLLAQRVMERCAVPYVSLDHLKMGMIRGLPGCPFTALNPDADIAAHLWPVAEAMAQVVLENGQHLILEGCYIPYPAAARLEREHPGLVRAVYLAFSREYLERHWEDGVLRCRDAIERRLFPEERTVEEAIREHRETVEQCRRWRLTCREISGDYERALSDIAAHCGAWILAARRRAPGG